METFDGFIEWMANGGGAVVVAAWLASWLLDDWALWNKIPAKGKKLLVLGMAAIVGVSGQLLYLHPELTYQLRPYLDTLTLVAGAWLSTQVFHKVDKAT